MSLVQHQVGNSKISLETNTIARSEPKGDKNRPSQSPTSVDLRAFFVGRDDVILSVPADSLLAKIYSSNTIKDGYGEVGPLTVVDIKFHNESGALGSLLFRMRQKGSRLYEIVQLCDSTSLHGVQLSVTYRREEPASELSSTVN